MVHGHLPAHAKCLVYVSAALLVKGRIHSLNAMMAGSTEGSRHRLGLEGVHQPRRPQVLPQSQDQRVQVDHARGDEARSSCCSSSHSRRRVCWSGSEACRSWRRATACEGACCTRLFTSSWHVCIHSKVTSGICNAVHMLVVLAQILSKIKTYIAEDTVEAVQMSRPYLSLML